MRLKNQLVTKPETAKSDRATPGVINRVRGVAGNHTLMRQLSTTEKVEPKVAKPMQRGGGGGQNTKSGIDSCRPDKGAVKLRRATSNAESVNGVPPIVHEVLRSPGQPLDAATRAFMEPRFGSDSNHEPVRVLRNLIQPQMTVNKPGDRYEREADRLSERVVNTSPKDLPAGMHQHDLSNVRVHTDTQAGESARAVNALAYTVGRDVVFAPGYYAPHSPSGRRLLAHELTHVLQQETGSTQTSFANPAPMVQRYTAFTSAEQLAGNSLGWVHPSSADLRVADDGQMAVEDNGWGAGLDKRAWATAANVAKSNAILSAQASRVKLVTKGAGISGKAPSSPIASVTLEEIEPKNAITGAALDLKADCGSACKQVMGSGGTDVAVLKRGQSESYTTPRTYHGGDPTTAEEWSEEIFKKEFGAGLTRAEAYAKYDALSAADKETFDQKYGINKFAVPTVGQGLTVSTEKDMPGFTDVPGAGMTWNFHYAATVLTSGSDYMTLENAAGWAPTDWIFFMYGPASKAQTFHEFHGATGTHGTDWTTLVVQPEKVLHVKTKVQGVWLIQGSTIDKLPLGTAVKVIEHSVDKKGIEWRKVEVESAGKYLGLIGLCMASFLE
jgi:hypothetical protein